MINAIQHIDHVLFLLIVAAGILHAKEPKIASKPYDDSTIFTLKLEPGANPTAGKSFKVRVHVEPKDHYRIWSSTMDSVDCCLKPLKLSIPHSLSNYFDLTNLKELSNPIVRYDSNFLELTKACYEPFDLIATIKVKKNAPPTLPFYLLVAYACASEKYCMPTACFAVPMTVLKEQPLQLKIAHSGKYNRGHELVGRRKSI